MIPKTWDSPLGAESVKQPVNIATVAKIVECAGLDGIKKSVKPEPFAFKLKPVQIIERQHRERKATATQPGHAPSRPVLAFSNKAGIPVSCIRNVVLWEEIQRRVPSARKTTSVNPEPAGNAEPLVLSVNSSDSPAEKGENLVDHDSEKKGALFMERLFVAIGHR